MSASLFSRLFASTPPPAAVEISARRVSAVALAVTGATRTITAHATESLAAGVVTPGLNAVNVHNQAALAAAVKTAVDRLTPRPRRVALILPDTVAKVSLLRFDKLPAKMAELDQLIKWQMRKAAPFRVEDAQVSWAEAGTVVGGGHEYLVAVARRDIIESYEKACDAAGVHAGLVDVASLNMVNAVLATQAGEIPGDWLLVHAEEDYTTLAVVRAGRVIFFRTRAAEDHTTADLGDLVHQTAMYHEDRLGGGAFARVVVAGSGAGGAEGADRVRRQIEERLGVRVEPLDIRSGVALRDRIVASPDLLDMLAPAAGVLLRDRVQARKPERVA